MSTRSTRTSDGRATATMTRFSPGVLRFSAIHLLIALVLLLVTIPFAQDFHYGPLVESVMMTIVLTSAVLVVGGRRRKLGVALLLVTPALIARWFDLVRPTSLSRAITMASGAIFVAFVVVQLLLFILRARRVNSEVLCAAVANYLLLALLFAFAQSLVVLLNPGAFAFQPGSGGDHRLTGFEALYFSFVTLSTVGYGDIVPVSNVARMLAMLEATTGTFYVAILIARLLAHYSSHTTTRHE